jgi:hypothetical protein
MFYSAAVFSPIAEFMRKLLLRFIAFLAAVWGLQQINLPTLLLGVAALMALVGAMHILATPENYDY